MTIDTTTSSALAARLSDLIEDHDVPGASLSVRHRDTAIDVTAGVLSRERTARVRPGTVFEVGSVTKVLTAVLVMQLVEDGRFGLDRPVREVLPELRLADDTATDTVTARHLLTHAAGFEGDVFSDTGEDADCLRRYMVELATTPQYFPPGVVFSYNNAGYAILGRLVEVLRDSTFDDALVHHVAGPLGLTSLYPQRSAVPARRRATGHRWDAAAGAWVATSDRLPRSLAPGGTRLCATAADLAAVGRALCGDGSTDLLPAPAVAAMQQPQDVDVPDLDGQWPSQRGLGWEIDPTDGATILGHDGDTIGHTSFLRVVPTAGLSIALLTNGGDARGLYADLVPELLTGLGGVGVPVVTTTPRTVPSVTGLLGRYAGAAGEYDVTGSSLDDLVLSRTPRGLVAKYSPPVRGRLRHVRGATFRWENDRPGDPQAVAFGPAAHHGGGASYLHNGRAHPRLV